MVDRRAATEGGIVGALVTLTVDLFAYGGEFLLTLAAYLALNADSLIALFSLVQGRIAANVEWLPADVLQKAIIAAALVYALVILYRLAQGWREYRGGDSA